MADAVCSNPGCGRVIAKKHVLCRPCAIAHSRGTHPYVEPCGSYQRDHVPHLQGFACRECGFDSALHPGSGRVALAKVRIAA